MMMVVAQCLYSPEADYVEKCELSDRFSQRLDQLEKRGQWLIRPGHGPSQASTKCVLSLVQLSTQRFASEEQLDNPFALIDFCKAFCQMPNNKAPDK